MGMLIDGVWRGEGDFHDADGHFRRQTSQFRAWVTTDESAQHPPDENRYHLYVAAACPWAHRTRLVRALKGLEDCISVSLVAPLMLENGWTFEAQYGDPIGHHDFLYQLYQASDPKYCGRVTVPVLYDKHLRRIVNNESSEIIRMLNDAFSPWAKSDLDLYPEELRAEIDAMNVQTYEAVNNGVYKAGFAASQDAYDAAVTTLFDTLDVLERHMIGRTYLVGNRLTEADLRLFTTLLRFDPVYVGHFKCNVRTLREYPNLLNMTRLIYGLPKVAETFDLQATKEHYYGSHPGLNPSGVVPHGPARWLD